MITSSNLGDASVPYKDDERDQDGASAPTTHHPPVPSLRHWQIKNLSIPPWDEKVMLLFVVPPSFRIPELLTSLTVTFQGNAL
jgi:hypothetical protein